MIRVLVVVACLVGLSDITRAQAVRCQVSGSCGSGWAAGRDERGTFVLTNAHVVGTRVGTIVGIDVPTVGGQSRVQGRVIAAAYDSRRQTDFAVVLTDQIGDGPVWPLDAGGNVAAVHTSCGSPRCVWPLSCFQSRGEIVSTTSPLVTWLPGSIGGQSGSALVADGVAQILLTWNINGRGGGQQTRWIFEQWEEQAIDSPERLPDMVEVGGRGPVCEDGFFSESGLRDLPIWVNKPGEDVPPDDDDDDGDDGVDAGPLVRRLAERLGLSPSELVILLRLVLRLLE